MPIDINLLRKEKGEDPEKVRESQKRRFADETLVDQVIDLDEQWRKANYLMETSKMEFNANNKAIADRKKASKGQDKCEDLMEKSKQIKAETDKLAAKAEDLDKQRTAKLNLIGNICGPNVPTFKDEDKNEVKTTWGEIPDIEVDGKTLGKLHHHEVMNLLDMVDLERGSNVAKHRGYFLKGVGVLLNQALINYGIATLHGNEYTPLQPPFFMKSSIMHETCQLSDFEENLYKVEGGDDDEKDKEHLYLIATSEQPISAMHRNEFIEPGDLPIRYAGNSSCFRKEAGSHGKDMWGIFRVHQFEKVEQFILCAPDQSWNELDRMIATSEKFYQSLKLPYQVVKIVSGALNDAAAMKMDLEAWFPGYKAYRELVSCSNCTDFQSRALKIRYAQKNLEKGQSTPYVHLLNGTLTATERTLCCIMENYQTDKGVVVPEVLRPFMGGLEFLPFVQKKVDAFLAKQEEEKGGDKKKGKGGKKDAGKAAAPKEEKKAKEQPAKKEAKKEAAPAKKAAASNPKFDELEKKLSKQQWLGGNQPSSDDKKALDDIKGEMPDAATHPGTFSWFCAIQGFSDAVKASWVAAKKDDDDLDDLFGDDGDAEPAPKPKVEVKKKKKEVIAMSLVMLDVKPCDSETNLDDLAQKIFKEILQEGLFWKTEYKKEPVAFGIFKLIIGFSCEDEKVSVDDIVERIEGLEELVQSVEITAFNKI